MTATREQELLRAFAVLADTLVEDYDVVELLQTLVETCSSLLGASASGVLLADENGDLDVVASTSEATRLVEVMQLGASAGPCIESFRTGRVVSVPDIRDVPEHWSAFRDKALELDFRAVHAIPMRLRDTTIGTLNLLRTEPGELPEDDLVAAKAFADVATIGILHERALAHSSQVRAQLQTALDSRVLIEQAKGVVAYRRRISVEEAFTVIRQYARSHQARLSAVAQAIVERTLEL
ncbi:GAF and ANTAR domain-containing protein [Leifsonia sp. 2TAF2]|uniref:GAF and ANTAR domain-containing protein n=1 Tax=Leifsonia sp. 2TAF2 TaxID=3233009 RepID=UPI003F9A86CC